MLGLDRETLNERRRSKLSLIKILLDIVAVAAEQPDNHQLQEPAEQAKQNLKQQTVTTAEFSAIVKLSPVPQAVDK